MPYFPTRTEQAYRCPGCQKWFLMGNMSCCVLHAPGSCCHEFEQPIDAPNQQSGKAD